MAGNAAIDTSSCCLKDYERGPDAQTDHEIPDIPDQTQEYILYQQALTSRVPGPFPFFILPSPVSTDLQLLSEAGPPWSFPHLKERKVSQKTVTLFMSKRIMPAMLAHKEVIACGGKLL